jgi:hypothetical protein
LRGHDPQLRHIRKFPNQIADKCGAGAEHEQCLILSDIGIVSVNQSMTYALPLRIRPNQVVPTLTVRNVRMLIEPAGVFERYGPKTRVILVYHLIEIIATFHTSRDPNTC